jgi:hypothetical protein
MADSVEYCHALETPFSGRCHTLEAFRGTGMGWGSNNAAHQSERFFPVPPAQAYAAVRAIVAAQRFKLKNADDFSMSVTFSSGASAFTWGENLSAQVVPAEGGANVRLQGVGKVGGQIQQSTRLNKLVQQLFEGVSNRLRAEVAGTS